MSGNFHIGDNITQHGPNSAVYKGAQSFPQPSRPHVFSGPPLVFVNYRSPDERAAFDLDAELTRRLGEGAVFRAARMPVGTAFPAELLHRAANCPVMLSVIGRHWENAYGTRPLDDPGDWVRREIATALRNRVHVAPVLVGARSRPAAADLPQEIRMIAHLQTLHLPMHYTGPDLRGLVDRLLRSVPALVNIRTVD
ncbi:TIR domain-containing protein [Lentzea sp. NPDC058450]|uniref:TIR domain-containing protein n=1 Tax=Lentzea sp. NPDC058450 TaxID=3346505 RepID=UPI0036661309